MNLIVTSGTTFKKQIGRNKKIVFKATTMTKGQKPFYF